MCRSVTLPALEVAICGPGVTARSVTPTCGSYQVADSIADRHERPPRRRAREICGVLWLALHDARPTTSNVKVEPTR